MTKKKDIKHPKQIWAKEKIDELKHTICTLQELRAATESMDVIIDLNRAIDSVERHIISLRKECL